MKLSFEQIKEITVGALNVWEEDGIVRFARCTPKQIEAWYKVDEVLGYRSECTTGVRLDFHTNSKTFAFTTDTKNCHEIYIDNVLTYDYFAKDFEDDNTCKEIKLDGKEHRITLYLPAHDEPGKFSSIEIDDGATLTPHKFDCKMLFIGDSITQGWESTWDSLSYAHHTSRFFNAESVIQGIGGAFYHKTTFDEAIDFEPDIVIVAYGTNDWNHYQTLEEGRDHCRSYLDQLIARYGDKKYFGISPIWRADKANDRPMGSFKACTDYVKEEIISHGMTLIDGESLTPHVPAFFSDEFLHPDTKGFGIYALNLIAQLQKYL